jgi:hypothetical protein
MHKKINSKRTGKRKKRRKEKEKNTGIWSSSLL